MRSLFPNEKVTEQWLQKGIFAAHMLDRLAIPAKLRRWLMGGVVITEGCRLDLPLLRAN